MDEIDKLLGQLSFGEESNSQRTKQSKKSKSKEKNRHEDKNVNQKESASLHLNSTSVPGARNKFTLPKSRTQPKKNNSAKCIKESNETLNASFLTTQSVDPFVKRKPRFPSRRQRNQEKHVEHIPRNSFLNPRSLSSSLLSLDSTCSNESGSSNLSSSTCKSGQGNFRNSNCHRRFPRQAFQSHRPFKSQRTEAFSLSYIKELSQKDSVYILQILKSQQNELRNFFSSPIKKENMISVLQFILKLCTINFELSKKELLGLLLNSVEFLTSFSSFIDRIVECSRTVSETVKNLQIIILFYNGIVNYIPDDKLVDFNDLLLKTVHIIKRLDDIPVEFARSVENVQAIISKKTNLLDKSQISYSELSVFPTKNDLSEEVTLRPNIINGPFNGIEDYIDMHFKLLKEDFISGLRSGMNQYLSQIKEGTRHRNHDIFIYKNVIYQGLSADDNPNKKLLHVFELEDKFLNKVQWEVSKRLIHGSLLLFSNNNFETIFMGVFNDKVVRSANISISVALIGKSIKLKKFSRYVMLESRVFFEPYYHVLNTLKNIHPQYFPLKRYIVHAETISKKPNYLCQNAEYVIDNFVVNINNFSSWPKPKDIKLNQSQLEAIQAALTRELVVIQGPPGTGKTYVGIKIIQILLENKDQWSDGKTPIFVVCYRNHAVDQILDQIAISGKKVVRLGGRSESTVLKDSTLKNTIGHMRDPIMFDRLKELKEEIIDIKHKITQLERLKMFVLENEGILSLSAFNEIMRPDHFKYLSSLNSYENWLLGGEEDRLFIESDDCEDISKLFDKKSKYSPISDQNPYIFLSIQHILRELEAIDWEIACKTSQYNETDGYSTSPAEMAEMTRLLTYYEEKLFLLRKINYRLNMKKSETPLPKLLSSELGTLTISERWTLYKHWANEFLNICEDKLELFIEQHNIKHLDFLEKKDLNDGENLRAAGVDVVGATTTGASRLHKLLSITKPKIVVIEEAAEVLEAHAIASLTEHCEHLILIGDHKQLRPSPASHASCVKYHLDVSLFERMINNGMDCFTLTEQHRMRPQISALVVPQIYPTLLNHPSVEEFPDLRGIKTNLYFVDHRVTEDELVDNESHQNKHEAYFVLALADYLVKQGYEESSITILTMYGAQLLFLKSVAKSKYSHLEDIEIQVVDNFQGEENKIILLSLVRSNSSTIGFLSKENRVCVALTRAKEGFIIIGNMETLQLNSSVWKQLKRTFEESSSIGEYLPLRCETHRRITKVQTSEDFKPLKNGGCTNECGAKLDCGHTCTFLCHGADLDHIKMFVCQNPCNRKRNCGIHDCTSTCGIDCPPCSVKLPIVLQCGHDGHQICAGKELPCTEKCSSILKCNHLCEKLCHYGNDDHQKECTADCGKPNISCPYLHFCPKKCAEECGDCTVDTVIELDCGHLCKGICSEVRKTKCEVLVVKDLNCGHNIEAPCFQPNEEITCTEKMKFKLACSHEVIAPCGTKKEDIICNSTVSKILSCGHLYKDAFCSSNTDELQCEEEINKSLSCGHSVVVQCFLTKSPIKCQKKCAKVLSCGHKCKGNCGAPCPPCKTGVKINDICGHTKDVACSKVEGGKTQNIDNIGPKNCKNVCNQLLKCDHTCKGTCGECMQGRIHTICNAVCNKVLICSHRCKNKCWNDFHYCNNKCLNKCKHQDCKQQCGEMCTKCMEPCTWACSHYKCSNKCWEMCDRPPCQFPCQLTLICGHSCFGFCGEPCPPICLICKPPNQEYDIKDRFILLEDCGHIISEKAAQGVISNMVGIAVCPNCNTAIVTTNYFRRYAKIFFSKYFKVKMKAQETYSTKGLIMKDFRQNFKLLNNILQNKYEGCDSLNRLLKNLILRTMPIMQNKRFNESKLSLKALLFICFYVTEALKMTKTENLNEENSEKLLQRINHLAEYLLHRCDKVSPSEMYMFFEELNRLRFIIDLMQLEQDRSCTLDVKNAAYYKKAESLAFSLKQFTSEEKTELIKSLMLIKQELSSNYLLLSTGDDDFNKIVHFFEKYYLITFHRDNWYRCPKNHIFYSVTFSESKLCPSCTNKANSLYFS